MEKEYREKIRKSLYMWCIKEYKQKIIESYCTDDLNTIFYTIDELMNTEDENNWLIAFSIVKYYKNENTI